MASMNELLHHLVKHTTGISDDNRQEFHDLVDEEHPAPEAEEPEADDSDDDSEVIVKGKKGK